MFKKLLIFSVLPYLAAHVMKASVGYLSDIHVGIVWSVLGASIAAIYTFKVLWAGKGDIKFAAINAFFYVVVSLVALFYITPSANIGLVVIGVNILSTFVFKVHPVEYNNYYN